MQQGEEFWGCETWCPISQCACEDMAALIPSFLFINKLETAGKRETSGKRVQGGSLLPVSYRLSMTEGIRQGHDSRVMIP